jgi:hypothetical protein
MQKEKKNMKNENIKRTFNLAIAFYVFVVVFNQFAGWAITEKSWIERLWITLVAGGGFGVLGAGIGMVLGGVGLALGGGAIGVSGWLAFSVLGFGAGALGGSILTIIQNPQNYDYDYFRLSIVVIFSCTIATASALFASKFGRWMMAYISGEFSREN